VVIVVLAAQDFSFREYPCKGETEVVFPAAQCFGVLPVNLCWVELFLLALGIAPVSLGLYYFYANQNIIIGMEQSKITPLVDILLY
jgi:hypothetical protein